MLSPAHWQPWFLASWLAAASLGAATGDVRASEGQVGWQGLLWLGTCGLLMVAARLGWLLRHERARHKKILTEIRNEWEQRVVSRTEQLTKANQSILRDVEEQRRLASALLEGQERIKAVLSTAVEGIITIDSKGLIEAFNPAAEKVFGYGAEEVLGRNVSVLMPSPDRERHDGYVANYVGGGPPRIIGIGREVVGQRKDGTRFPMDLAVSEVRLADKRLFTGFVRDITERKRAEHQLASLARSLSEKNKELETIVHVASHDLRSPLVNIQGFSQELMRTSARLAELLRDSAQPEVRRLLKEDMREALDFILAGVHRMSVLFSGFLRFSRLGRAALNLEALDMNRMLAGIAKSMDFQLQQAAITLEVQSLPSCRGDETQINQVFSNLLDNAIKYRSPLRPGRIVISGHRDQDHVLYSVRDNGLGIAPEHQGKVFEIFHRLNPKDSEGDGLGLAIAQRILERHNGTIRVESTCGDGSTFFVALPAA